jgi:hypothetical protein
MHRHRLAQEADAYRLPAPPPPPFDPAAFALVPVPLPATPAGETAYQQLLALYRAALAEARAVVRPSVLERRCLAGPN